MTVQTWVPASLPLGAPLIDGVYDSAVFPLGYECQAQDRSGRTATFIFLEGVASTVVGSWVTYDDEFLTALLVRDAVGPVAIAMAATVADKYGWFMIAGSYAIGKSNDAADTAAVYTSTSPGIVDDAASTGERVWRAIYRSNDDTGTTTTGVAGTAYFQIWRPEVTNGLAAGAT